MEEGTSLISKILIVICGIAVITFSIMSTVLYIYTIYYYAVDDGFLGAVYGIFLPGFSSVTLFFELILKKGNKIIFKKFKYNWYKKN